MTLSAAVPPDLDLDPDLGHERVDGVPGGALLPEAKGPAGGHDHQDDQPVAEVAQGHRQHRGRDQDQHDRAGELGQQQPQPSVLAAAAARSPSWGNDQNVSGPDVGLACAEGLMLRAS
jgi:hypothetical protein